MKYAQERKQFNQSIANFQGIQFQIAQMATEIEAVRMMVYNAARMKDAGMNFVKEAAMTKLFASQVAERVTSLSRRDIRRLRLHQGLSRRKVFPRCEDRQDLRRHFEHAAFHDRQTGDGQIMMMEDNRSEQERRKFVRLDLTENVRALDAEGRDIGRVEKVGAGGMQIRISDILPDNRPSNWALRWKSKSWNLATYNSSSRWKCGSAMATC